LKYVKIETENDSLFCPISGELIFNESEMNENARSLLGYWVGEVIDTPTIKDKKLQKAWDDLVIKCGANGVETEDLQKMLHDHEHQNAVVFEIFKTGWDGGYLWFVLDLGILPSLK